MFKRIILFLFFVFPLQAVQMPELDGEDFVSFPVNPPYKMLPYVFTSFSSNEPEIIKDKQEKNDEKKEEKVIDETLYCRGFSFAAGSVELTEANQKIIEDIRLNLKPEQKAYVVVFYKNDVDFNERENRRNAVKRSSSVQRYLMDKNVDEAQIFTEFVGTDDGGKAGFVDICLRRV